MKKPTWFAIKLLALATIVTGYSAAQNASKPNPETYVLVHGAWNAGFGFKKIDQMLRAEGHTVYRPTLTGLGERSHLASPDIDLDTHIQDVVNLMVWEDLKDVILVGRSYGGMVITGVVDRVPERIKQVVYLDAFLPMNGESLLDISQVKVRVGDDGFVATPPPLRVQPGTPPPYAVPHPGKTFTQKLRLKNPDIAARLPATYILTVLPGKRPEEDEFFKHSERARARNWKVVVMEGDHSPERSAPDKLLGFLIP